MFSATNLFKSIPCPGNDRCLAPNCIFSHDPEILAKSEKTHGPTSQNTDSSSSRQTTDQHAIKRRKLDLSISTTPPETALPQANVRATDSKSDAVKRGTTFGPITEPQKQVKERPRTLERPISPPRKQKTPADRATGAKTVARPKESLNPRTLPTPPAGHDKRMLFLKYIHAEMTRLNNLVASSGRSDKEALHLDDQELIKTSLDEEEQLAKGNSAVYANHVKQRISHFKKMKLDDWISHLKTNIFTTRKAQSPQSGPKAFESGLTVDQERLVLRTQLLTPLDKLLQLGYVVLAPAAEAIEDARRLVQQAANWEVCDRCKTRFQVFPERRVEDGVLTTNGPCTYHWGKLRRPKREKTDAITGSKDSIYLCCGEPMNSPGCSSAESHVYKMNEPARLASVVQYIDTPDNPNPAKLSGGRRVAAITFDCEMGYTALGLELIRLTAVAWPSNEELIDILVQPKGTILDFNSRFSGVFAETFRSAVQWTENTRPLPMQNSGGGDSLSPLPIVSSPEVARKILCSYITPDTPLIGHALENDLNSVRLCHRKVVDTVALYPHPRGLPIRHSLRQLAFEHLGRHIQTAGAAGHDSLEDARATGDLVRVKAAKKWTEMKTKGLDLEEQRTA
ncbi:hypothetical protein ANO11243_059500 [Dothideomycetidae sp. 11243]|nr:hypothetical protein ANO11243_059500 [fungal sp. No.11243]